ncbi:MAG TPA: DUF2071 domain-containing protein [Micromonosporaceae bacterium]
MTTDRTWGEAAPGGRLVAPEAPPVPHPIMIHHWHHLTFLHWRYPAHVVQTLLPPGLDVETCDGSAWVGVVPFLMTGVRAPFTPPLPWLSRFPETNVRTYVRGPDGRSGIWFFSLDAARLPAVLAARAGFGLPYQWSDMTVRVTPDVGVYRSRRRGPGPAARCDATVRWGAYLDETRLHPLDHFLTARFRLYSVLAGRLVAANAAHKRWALRRGELTYLRQDVVQASGLPAPQGDPLVHTSPGVRVRIGMWHPVLTPAG